LKQRKENYVSILLNVSTVRVITVYSENTDLTGIGITKNHKSSEKSKPTQFSQLCAMILKSLKIFSQNVHKNRLLTDTLLENNKDFDIIFIQEPS